MDVYAVCLSGFFQEKADLGEVMFSLCYLPTACRLTLTVIKARNLKAMDITGASGIASAIDKSIQVSIGAAMSGGQ